MSTTTDVAATVIGSADPPAMTVPDLLAEEARIVAVEDAMDRRKAQVRERLDVLARAIEAQTKAAFNAPVKGVGRAYRDEPSLRPEVVDDDEWRSWALTNRPDDAKVVTRVNADVLERALSGEHGEALADLLDRIPGAVREDVAISANLLERLTDECARAERNDDVWLVARGTGEFLPVRLTASREPRLTVRIDKKLRERLRDEIEAALTPLPTLPSSDPDRAGPTEES